MKRKKLVSSLQQTQKSKRVNCIGRKLSLLTLSMFKLSIIHKMLANTRNSIGLGLYISPSGFFSSLLLLLLLSFFISFECVMRANTKIQCTMCMCSCRLYTSRPPLLTMYWYVLLVGVCYSAHCDTVHWKHKPYITNCESATKTTKQKEKKNGACADCQNDVLTILPKRSPSKKPATKNDKMVRVVYQHPI